MFSEPYLTYISAEIVGIIAMIYFVIELLINQSKEGKGK